MRLKGIAKVTVYHRRPQLGGVSGGALMYSRKEFARRGTKPAPKGGFTMVRVELEDGRVGVGTARCSEKDNFEYAVGRKIALDRALADLRFTSEIQRAALALALEDDGA